MRTPTTILALCVGTFVALASVAHAAPILSVTGPESSSSPGGIDPIVLAQGFVLGQNLTNVSISADIVCFGCAGDAMLTTDLGPTSDFSDVVAASAFSGASTIFSGLNLAAGQYYLVLWVDTGAFGWRSSETPTLSAAPGSSVGLSAIATTIDILPFASDFALIDGGQLLFAVQADAPNPVPAPPAAALFALGLLGAAFRRCNT